MEGAVDASWAALEAENDLRGRRYAGKWGREMGTEGGSNGNSSGKGERVELGQAKCSRGVFGCDALGTIEAIARPSRALSDEIFLEDLRNQAISRFRGARKKGAMALVECYAVPQEDTMEGSLLRKTLGKSLR